MKEGLEREDSVQQSDEKTMTTSNPLDNSVMPDLAYIVLSQCGPRATQSIGYLYIYYLIIDSLFHLTSLKWTFNNLLNLTKIFEPSLTNSNSCQSFVQLVLLESRLPKISNNSNTLNSDFKWLQISQISLTLLHNPNHVEPDQVEYSPYC